MYKAFEFTLLIFLMKYAYGIVLSITRMNDKWQTSLPRYLNVTAETFLLTLLVAFFVIVVLPKPVGRCKIPRASAAGWRKSRKRSWIESNRAVFYFFVSYSRLILGFSLLFSGFWLSKELFGSLSRRSEPFSTFQSRSNRFKSFQRISKHFGAA